MKKVLRVSASLVLASFFAAWGCSNEDDGGLTPQASSSGNGGTGMTAIDAGLGDSGEGGVGGADEGDGTSNPDACPDVEELKECGESSVEAEFRTTNILLVIDKSGSMTDTPEGFELTKWDALKAALEQALPDVAAEMNFGLVLYPYSFDEEIPLDCDGDICCSAPTAATGVNVPIEEGATSVPKVLEALNDTAPGGGTPTAAALRAAYDYFLTGEGAVLKGDSYVLLATDGGPNCNSLNTCEGDTCTQNLDGQCSNENCCANGLGSRCLDDASVVGQIEALNGLGVPTFVVGIPGTETYADYLNAFAISGGVPNPAGDPDYYAVEASEGVQALTDTFREITTHLVRSCEVPLAGEPPDDTKVNVLVNCEVLPKEDGANWDFAEDDKQTLIIKGEACEQIESQGARRIDVFFGCNPIR